MVVDLCNPRTLGKPSHGDSQFKSSPSNLLRCCLKKELGIYVSIEAPDLVPSISKILTEQQKQDPIIVSLTQGRQCWMVSK